MQNLSIFSARKTATRVTPRRRSKSTQLLEEVLGAAEDALLDASQTDAVIAHLAGQPYRIRLRTLGGVSHVIVAIVENGPARPRTAEDLRARFGFTEREAEVALLLADRLTNKEISRTLGVTTYTAERHTERILAKLGINSRRHVNEAIAFAV